MCSFKLPVEEIVGIRKIAVKKGDFCSCNTLDFHESWQKIEVGIF